MGTYQNFTEYSPVHKVIVFGGGNGSNALYVYDVQGNITTKKTPPLASLGVTHTIITADPVTGNLLVFGKNRSMYEYNPIADTWTPLNIAAAPFFDQGPDGPVFGTVATPVGNYGVSLFLNWNWNNSSVYLYKHAEDGTTNTSGISPINENPLRIVANPNPFNQKIKIAVSHQLSAVSNFDLKLFNVNGTLVKKLTVPPGRDRQLIAGISWNAETYPAGVYIAHIRINGRTYSKRLFLQK
jgi:hypothetical protein